MMHFFIDPCSSSPCQNGASCQLDGRSDYRCNCVSGWNGTNCETGQYLVNSFLSWKILTQFYSSALIRPVVECVFRTDTSIVVGYSVLPPERGYDSSLISVSRQTLYVDIKIAILS